MNNLLKSFSVALFFGVFLAQAAHAQIIVTPNISIATCADLQNIGQVSNEPLNGSYVVANDIDCRISFTWNGGTGFKPIGGVVSQATTGHMFSGTFDGAGYKISNLYVNNATVGGLGLFGTITGPAVIKNVNLVNVDIKGGLAGIVSGGIAGQDVESSSVSTISNVSVSGKVSGWRSGGIMGAATFVNISNSSFIGSVEAATAGGILGSISGPSTIANSYAQATLASTTTHPSVNTTESIVGGLVGLVQATTPNGISISNSYSASSLSYPAGFPAFSSGQFGGLVGMSPGFSAANILSNCYFDKQYARLDLTDIFVNDPAGMTTAAMYTQQVFSGWDFQTKWGIHGGFDYPYLLSQVPVPTPTGFTGVAGNGQATLSWSAVPGAAGYSLAWSTKSGGPYNTSQEWFGQSLPTSFTVTGLTNGITYYFVISASNGSGVGSPRSPEVSVTPAGSSVQVPPAPSSFSANVSNGAVVLSWTEVTGAASYNVKRSSSASGPFTTIMSPSGTTATYTDSSVTAGSTYYYQVTAVNAAGESAPISAGPITVTSSTGPVSPDGSTLAVGSSGSLVTTGGNTWTFSTTVASGNNLILLNGKSASGYGILLAVENGGKMYVKNNSNSWYVWTGSGWAATTNPIPVGPPVVITASAGANGSISPSGAVNVQSGTSQIFTVTPNAGYSASISVDGAAATLTNNTYTFTSVTAVHTIAATFTLVPISPDGSTLAASSSGSLATLAGTWTFSTTVASGNNLIFLNGKSAGGYGILLVVANNGKMYTENAQGAWYVWSGSWGASNDPLPNVTLTIAYTGAAVSNIASTPAGINCNDNSATPGTCTASFPFGSAVALKATEGAGSFSWGGTAGCSNGPMTCSLTMTSNLTINANSSK